MIQIYLRIAALAALTSTTPIQAQAAAVPPAATAQMVGIDQITSTSDRPAAATIEQIGSSEAAAPQLLLASYNPVSTAASSALEFARLPMGIAASVAAPVDATGNISLIQQPGNDNTVTIEQSGLLNTSLVLQSGNHNQAMVVQTSDGNVSIVSQFGFGGYVSVHQGAG